MTMIEKWHAIPDISDDDGFDEETCPDCGGVGHTNKASGIRCYTCKGKGIIKRRPVKKKD